MSNHLQPADMFVKQLSTGTSSKFLWICNIKFPFISSVALTDTPQVLLRGQAPSRYHILRIVLRTTHLCSITHHAWYTSHRAYALSVKGRSTLRHSPHLLQHSRRTVCLCLDRTASQTSDMSPLASTTMCLHLICNVRRQLAGPKDSPGPIHLPSWQARVCLPSTFPQVKNI